MECGPNQLKLPLIDRCVDKTAAVAVAVLVGLALFAGPRVDVRVRR